MAHDIQAVGVLLVEGHTRVYHGSLIKRPRRYVSSEKLRLRVGWLGKERGERCHPPDG